MGDRVAAFTLHSFARTCGGQGGTTEPMRSLQILLQELAVERVSRGVVDEHGRVLARLSRRLVLEDSVVKPAFAESETAAESPTRRSSIRCGFATLPLLVLGFLTRHALSFGGALFLDALQFHHQLGHLVVRVVRV
eukprot:Amastigsp_a676678_192.p2 type:complete len:136 gc:universal Amastigsp_a676678_192:1-408(+)